jgi:hypothetical protein
MSIQIKTIDLLDQIPLVDRDVNLNGIHVQSVNIYQTDGSFVTTEPFENKVIWYPQNPNNVGNTLLGEWKIYTTFSGYGALLFPTDARFDYTRRVLWIADSGNKRVLKVDVNSGTVINSASNGYISNSLAININTGYIYVKSIKDENYGIIHSFNQKAELQNTFEFPCHYVVPNVYSPPSYAYLFSLPLPSSMTYNHVLNRLWWVGGDRVYMMDTLNKNIVTYNIYSDGFTDLRSVDVDFKSGNAFLIARKIGYESWYILQMFRDNNNIVSVAYIKKIIPSSRPYGV